MTEKQSNEVNSLIREAMTARAALRLAIWRLFDLALTEGPDEYRHTLDPRTMPEETGLYQRIAQAATIDDRRLDEVEINLWQSVYDHVHDLT